MKKRLIQTLLLFGAAFVLVSCGITKTSKTNKTTIEETTTGESQNETTQTQGEGENQGDGTQTQGEGAQNQTQGEGENQGDGVQNQDDGEQNQTQGEGENQGEGAQNQGEGEQNQTQGEGESQGDGEQNQTQGEGENQGDGTQNQSEGEQNQTQGEGQEEQSPIDFGEETDISKLKEKTIEEIETLCTNSVSGELNSILTYSVYMDVLKQIASITKTDIDEVKTELIRLYKVMENSVELFMQEPESTALLADIKELAQLKVETGYNSLSKIVNPINANYIEHLGEKYIQIIEDADNELTIERALLKYADSTISFMSTMPSTELVAEISNAIDNVAGMGSKINTLVFMTKMSEILDLTNETYLKLRSLHMSYDSGKASNMVEAFKFALLEMDSSALTLTLDEYKALYKGKLANLLTIDEDLMIYLTEDIESYKATFNEEKTALIDALDSVDAAKEFLTTFKTYVTTYLTILLSDYHESVCKSFTTELDYYINDAVKLLGDANLNSEMITFGINESKVIYDGTFDTLWDIQYDMILDIKELAASKTDEILPSVKQVLKGRIQSKYQEAVNQITDENALDTIEARMNDCVSLIDNMEQLYEASELSKMVLDFEGFVGNQLNA